MEKQLFRKKTMERISSPEQLQDYMRVTSPGIWMVLTAVILLLAGLIIASATGKVESTLSARGQVRQGVDGIVVQLPLERRDEIRESMAVRVGEQTGHIDLIYENAGLLNVVATLDYSGNPLPEGTYDVTIVTETLRPISFLLN